MVELVRENELDHSIPEIFESLIVEVVLLRFVSERWMRESFLQEGSIGEFVADSGFQRIHCEMGWLTGFEPATTGTTNRGSTPELQPPSSPKICGGFPQLGSERSGKYGIVLQFPMEFSRVFSTVCDREEACVGLSNDFPFE